MEDYLNKSLPGAGYTEICATLDLDPESPVKDILAAIQALKKQKPEKKRHLKEVKKTSDYHTSDK